MLRTPLPEVGVYKLHHLVTFQAVHRTGSFALAARELDYTPSAVSQQIAALERECGLVLFERQAQGVRATAAADQVAELSRPLLAGAEEFGRRVRALAAGRGSRLVLGSFPTASVQLVPAALTAFGSRCPHSEITLEEGEPEELIEGVADGGLDLALVYEYGLCPRTWSPNLTVRALTREGLFLLEAPGGGPGQDRIERLRDRHWITSREGTAGALSLTRLCASAGFEPRVLHRSNDYDVVRELVIATGAVAVVPELGHTADDRIAATRITRHRAHRTVLVAYRTGNVNPLIGEFLDALQQVVPGWADR